MFSKWTIALILLLAVKARAQEIIFIQAPGASPSEFKEVAKNTTGLQTILELQAKRIQNNPQQEEKLFALGEQLNRSPLELIQDLERLHQEASWTEVSLNFLKDLSDKILAVPLKPTESSFFKSLSCQSQLLSEEAPNVSCPTMKIDLATIHRQWPMAQVLMIESKMIALDEQSISPEILSSGIYHWTLLSNSAQSISFYGTYEHFLQQRLIMENWVDGTCEGFSAKVDDFQIASKSLVFFSKDCTKRFYRPQQKTSFAEWIDHNKKWVYPLGGLLLGGVILTAQGKTLVIDKP